ncbi:MULTISPECIES: vitamin K epoxide reductase family protein [unclassified Streptosporangium]|uniref:vitamin K epoxide reductase family protein n=1 Tax=unclassified Streptosporangium TaxID=2632669 RepID=UPI002E2D8C44|nr:MULTISPECIES: vitamin K epoxide reductase family protein [unclassified Streptosporangium]
MQRSPAEATAEPADDQPSTAHDRLDAAEPVGPDAGPFPRLLPWLLLIGGAIGLGAAFTLAVEKIALLKDPTYVPSCSINPVLSCGSVMTTPQAEVFGFPNPLLGIAAFALVATIGAALLSGARLGRWFWLGLQAGVTFGVVFVHWLIVQSLYVIGALCPYCMLVWAVTIPSFLYVTLHNLHRRHLPAPAGGQRVVEALVGYHAVALTVWFLALLTMIGVRFWSYWSTLL